LMAQQLPAPTELPGDPFFIKNAWKVGGSEDSLNSMVLEPGQLRLFLAYRHALVISDFKSGTIAGNISGTFGAYGIALDDTDEFGYISDGRFNQVDIFDRRSLQIVGVIPTAPNPTSVVFEPLSALVFVICNEPLSSELVSKLPSVRPLEMRPWARPLEMHPWERTDNELRPIPKPNGRARLNVNQEAKSKVNLEYRSYITVIDANSWKALANIQLRGKLNFAQTGGGGHVYIGTSRPFGVVRLNAEILGDYLRNSGAEMHAVEETTPKQDQLRIGKPYDSQSLGLRFNVPSIDWSDPRKSNEISGDKIIHLGIGRDCEDLRSLAVDERHVRLFLACGNTKMTVLNADTGAQIASLPTGGDTSAITYDPDRWLIYAANNGGDASLTIIRQSVTDSYAVIQNLPVPHGSRALSVDAGTGLVYMAADYSNLDGESRRSNGIKGNFQVLVIGH
jgi:hypothetical protein